MKLERKCHWQSCDSGARWQPHLHIECQGVGIGRALSLISTIECCDEHRENVKPYVLSDANREAITTKLMDEGYPEPNFLTARIEFKPIEDRGPVAVETCNREGCTEFARWRIVQAIPHMTKIGDVERLRTNLVVCDKHKAEVVPADLLDPESKAATHRALKARGLALRSLKRMKLEFEAMR
ncbi:MAG TPA: hypothetical protein VLJ17_15215 [Xanthobacteraceae bacterium]|nr:hypothetical protein [Xanthobacteraceae bacterium]